MPTAEHMKATVEAYAAAHSAGDVDGIAALFAPDAVVADPVDQPAHHGRDAVRAFFAGTHEFVDAMELQVTGPIRAVDRFAAVPLRRCRPSAGARSPSTSSTCSPSDDDGLIADMRAYWSSSDIRPLD